MTEVSEPAPMLKSRSFKLKLKASSEKGVSPSSPGNVPMKTVKANIWEWPGIARMIVIYSNSGWICTRKAAEFHLVMIWTRNFFKTILFLSPRGMFYLLPVSSTILQVSQLLWCSQCDHYSAIFAEIVNVPWIPQFPRSVLRNSVLQSIRSWEHLNSRSLDRLFIKVLVSYTFFSTEVFKVTVPVSTSVPKTRSTCCTVLQRSWENLLSQHLNLRWLVLLWQLKCSRRSVKRCITQSLALQHLLETRRLYSRWSPRIHLQIYLFSTEPGLWRSLLYQLLRTGSGVLDHWILQICSPDLVPHWSRLTLTSGSMEVSFP